MRWQSYAGRRKTGRTAKASHLYSAPFEIGEFKRQMRVLCAHSAIASNNGFAVHKKRPLSFLSSLATFVFGFVFFAFFSQTFIFFTAKYRIVLHVFVLSRVVYKKEIKHNARYTRAHFMNKIKCALSVRCTHHQRVTKGEKNLRRQFDPAAASLLEI